MQIFLNSGLVLLDRIDNFFLCGWSSSTTFLHTLRHLTNLEELFYISSKKSIKGKGIAALP